MILSEAAQWAVTRRWKYSRRGRIFDSLADPDAHFHFFDQKYVHPSFSDLVGPTLPAHRGPDGQITLERKAQLLLIGVLAWSGFYLAKRRVRNEADPHGWYAVTQYDLTRPLELYCDHWSYRGKPVEDPKPSFSCLEEHYFDPFASLRPTPLERILSSCPPDQRVAFLDGNPYDCRTENLILLPKRGRPMRCRNCNQEVFDGHHFAVGIRQNMTLRLCARCRARISEVDLERLIRHWD